MISPLAIQIAASGGNAVVRSFQQIAAGARQVQSAMKDITDTSPTMVKAAQAQGRAWASAWSPGIKAAKDFQAEQKRIAEQQRAINSGSATAWNPYISAVNRAQNQTKALRDEQKRLADQQKAVNSGAASAWNPYISNVKRAQVQTKALSDDQKRLADQQKAINSGSASAWNPYVSATKRASAATKSLDADLKRTLANQRQAISAGAASAWNPYISSIQQARAEQRKLADEHKQQMAQMAARQKPVNGAGAASTWNPHVSAQQQQVAVQQRQADRQNAGLAMTAMGVGGGALMFNAAQNAGKMDLAKQGFSSSMGGDQSRVDALYAKIEDFDRRSSFSMEQSAQAAQLLLNMSMSDREIPRMMDALGNMVAAGGGTTANFERAALQVGQISASGRITNEDANALTEGGRLPMAEIIKSTVGEGRYKKWRTGDEEIKASEILPGMQTWAEKNRGQGMENAQNTLPGQISALQSEFFKLSVLVGGDLMPVIKAGTVFLRLLVQVLNAIPGPIRKVLVFIGALGIALVTLGGLFITASIGMAGLTTALGLGGGAAGLATLSMGGLAATVSGVLAPAITGLAGVFSVALLPAIAALAISAVAAAAIIKAIEWTKEAATKSDEEMEGPNSSFRQQTVSQAGRGLASMFNRDETAQGDAAENESAAIFAKMRKKSPYRKSSKPALPAPSTTPTPAATTGAVNFAMAANGTNPTTLPSVSTSAMAGVGTVGNIDALQERIMLSDDKGEKSKLRQELFYARRNDRYRKASEREAKREENEQKREAKTREREEKRAAKERERLQDRIADRQSDIEVAQVKADIDMRIEALKAQRTRRGDNRNIDYQIGMLRAQKTEQVAAIKARHDDSFAEGGGTEVAGYKSAAQRQKAALALQKSKGGRGELFSHLRGGGSVFDFGKDKSHASDFGRSVSRETPSADSGNSADEIKTVTAQNHITRNSTGRKILKIIVPDVPLDDDFNGALADFN